MRSTQKVLSLLITLCLVLGLMPTALAASISGSISASTTWPDGSTVDGTVTISGGSATNPLTITVNGTVTVNAQIQVTGGYVVFTGGGKLLRGSTNGTPILAKGGASLTLESITVDGDSKTGPTSPLLEVQSASSLTMKTGAAVQNNNSATTVTVGGVSIKGGSTFTMEGGTITGNTSIFAGGVYVSESSTFTMNGGSITGNHANSTGGCMQISGGGRFVMNGGSITNNTAGRGGGIYNEGSSIVLNGGSITGNAAVTHSGGICNDGSLTLGSPGTQAVTVTDNTRGGNASNVYLLNGRGITLTGAPAEGTQIGVNTETAPGADTSVSLGTGTGVTQDIVSSCIIPDVSTYKVDLVENGSLQLSRYPVPENVMSAITGYTSTYDGAEHDAVEKGDAVTADYTLTYSDSENGIYSDTMPTIRNKGTKTVWVKVSGTNYADTKTSVTAEVEAKSLSGEGVTTITLGDQATYNGTEQEVVITSVTVAGITVELVKGEDKDYTITAGGSATNVEDTTLTITGTGNYKDTATVKWSLQKAALTLPDAAVDSKPYDESDAATITPGALTGVVTGDDVSVAQTSIEGAFDTQYAGTNKTVTTDNEFTLTGEKAGNYTLTQPANLTGSITAAEQRPTITPTASLGVGGKTLNLSTLVTGAMGDVSFVISGGVNGCFINGSTLTSGNAEGTVKINVNITAKNVDANGDDEYSPYTGTDDITVTLTPKLTQDDFRFEQTTQAKVYGAPDFTVEATGAETPVTYASSDRTVATVNENTGEVHILKAGTVIITATAAETPDYARATAQYTLTVDKKAVTVKALNKTAKMGDPTPSLENPVERTDYTVEGLVSGDALSGTLTLAYDPEPNMAVEGTYSIVPSGLSDSEGKYAITYENGTLTVGAYMLPGLDPNTDTDDVAVKPDTGAAVTGNPDGGYHVGDPGGSVVLPGADQDKSTDADNVTVNVDGPFDVKPDGTITLPAGSTATTGDGRVIAGPATIKPDGTVERPSTGGGSGGGSSSSSGGGGGGSAAYPPVVKDPDHGDVTATPKNPGKGDIVIIRPDPDKGYEVADVVVTKPDGTQVSVKDRGDGTWSYTQPGVKVTITVTFRPVEGENSGYGGCSGSQSCPIRPFTDADPAAWYHDGVHYCLDEKLMVGYEDGTFRPEAHTSRAMVVTVLWRLEGSPVVNYALPFEDVAPNGWYAEAVRWAAANGIVEGYSDSAFGPDDSITREQMAAILYRYCKYKGVSGDDSADLSGYTDAADVSGWAVSALRWACGAGLMEGVGNNTLLPTGTATRAQTATLLLRLCERAGKQ